jgi:hypothetical protein
VSSQTPYSFRLLYWSSQQPMVFTLCSALYTIGCA